MKDNSPLVLFSRWMTRIDVVMLTIVVILGVIWAFIRG